MAVIGEFCMTLVYVNMKKVAKYEYLLLKQYVAKLGYG